MNSNKNAGFSLIEMLMALLVASLLLTALAPVMIKKTQDKFKTVQEYNNFSGTQTWINPGNYTFQVPDGISILKIQATGAGGGGGGATAKDINREAFTTNQTFIVPKGVSQITFELLGGGGGGSGGFGKALTDSCPAPYKLLPGFSDAGRDLCYIPYHPTTDMINTTSYLHIIDAKTPASRARTCFVGTTNSGARTASGSEDANTRALCLSEGVQQWCAGYMKSYYPTARTTRLITVAEFTRMLNFGSYPNYTYFSPDYLDLTSYYSNSDLRFSLTGDYISGCSGAGLSDYCKPSIVILSGGWWQFYTGCTVDCGPKTTPSPMAGLPRCVYEVMDWETYSGGGGASGMKLTQTINVSPNDKLEFAIGAGGVGAYRSGGGGGEGGTSYLRHKNSSGTLIKEYYAQGAIGGSNNSTGNAAATNTTRSCSAGGICEFISGKGSAGTNISGGAGAGGPAGGTVDSPTGANATEYGYGGGGGYCPAGSKSYTTCAAGGKGGNGAIYLSYKSTSPGGGGGSGGAIGLNGTTNEFVQIKVAPMEIISFTVGNGGEGGTTSAYGKDGHDTIIHTPSKENFLIFKGGKGGSPGTFNVNNVQIGGLGGNGGQYPNINFSQIINPTTTSISLVNQTVSGNGKQGATDSTGFNGGMGGATRIGATGACGGKQFETGICNNTSVLGSDATMHNASANKLGGAGGGGGGSDGISQGTGGFGANGYVRIKWDGASALE